MATDVIGHGGVLRELRLLAAQDEAPHAIILAGPIGTGRTLLAREFARLLNCEAERGSRPCGECRACRLIAGGNHPDVIALGPGDTLCKPRPDESHEKHPQSRDIRICQVRGLIDLVSRYPVEGRYRVVIIEPADLLGETSQDAMLKTLEEPPPHTVFLLVAQGPERLPETILSRCRRVDVRIVPRPELEAGLVAKGFAPEVAARAAEHAHGKPALALSFAEHPDRMDDLGRLLERCAGLVSGPVGNRFTYAQDLAERWRRDRSLVHVELDAWEVFWEEQLRLAAAGESPFKASEALDALRAVLQARQDLQDLVMTRGALELMLVSFPRGRMVGRGTDAGAPEGDPVPA